MPLTDAQVIAAFGDPLPYVRPDGTIDGAWETAILTSIELPAPLPASWDRRVTIRRLRVHRRIAPLMLAALETVCAQPYVWATIGDVGGCYAWRPVRGNPRALSRHSWGLAIDLDVADNPLGAGGRMDPLVIAAFRAEGFEWGGAWRRRKDPMHFEFSALARLG